MDVFAIVVAFVAVSTAVSGIALLLRRRAVVSAALLVCAGAAGILAVVLLAADHDRSSAVALVAGASLFAPAAIMTFPRLRWRHPVDFISLVVIVGCGTTALMASAISSCSAPLSR